MNIKHIISTPSLLTREQAADYLGVKVSTLAAWACHKRVSLPMIRVGRLVKYRLQDLEDYINRNTTGKEVVQ